MAPKGKRLLLESLEPRILWSATPEVSIDSPFEAMLNEEVQFRVEFDNTGPDAQNDIGYRPYVDLHMPDELSFKSAHYAVAPIKVHDAGVFVTEELEHPFTGEIVTGNIGDHLYVLELPFGSFTPDQASIPIDIKADLTPTAEYGVPADIKATSGFAYGADPLDNPSVDPPIYGNTVTTQVTPTVLKLNKFLNAAESETATGRNYPVTYTLTVDIADGVEVTNLEIKDLLPKNSQYIGNLTYPGSPSIVEPSIGGPQNSPNNELNLTYANFTGQATDQDIVITYQVFIPELDADMGYVINANTGDDATSLNMAFAEAEYDADGPGGNPGVTVSDSDNATLNDRSIAIQKGVSIQKDTGAAGATPGDTLEYTLNFQVSDYFSFDQINIQDIFSDGQLFDATYTPTFSIYENGVSTNGIFDVSNFNYAQNSPGDGTTTVNFDLSNQLILEGQDGVLYGDLFLENDLTSGTVGSIKFRTVIQEEYSDNYPSTDKSVDAGDVLGNNVSITGRIPSSGNLESDTSSASISIVKISGQKTLYAINGVAPSGNEIQIGDAITYSLELTLPASDIENLLLEDFLPLPIYYASEVQTFDDVVSADAPIAGHAKFGPNHTLHTVLPGQIPTLDDAAGNLLKFDYGTFDDPMSQSATIQILFTVTVTDEPFGDKLLLTNQFQASYGTTQQESFQSQNIHQVILVQPVVQMTKGIVGKSNATAEFTEATGPAGVSFFAPGIAGSSFTGTINSDGIKATPINSDLEKTDAGDLVKFAIVVENIGSAPNGAFDVLIRDSLPSGFEIPTTGALLNLKVQDGAGNNLAYTIEGTGLFDPSGGIRLNDGATGALSAYHDTSGTNIAVITYDLLLADSVAPSSEVKNGAEVVEYSAQEGGNDYTEDVEGKFSDDAIANVQDPGISKALVSTSEGSTSGSNLTIGEVATYELTVTLPEGTSPNLQVIDRLPDGMAYVAGSMSIIAGAFQGTLPNPSVTCAGTSGADITFDFSEITVDSSTNTNNNQFVIQYQAQVLDVPGNVGTGSQTTLTNNATVDVTGDDTDPIQSNDVNITVVEPDLEITKSFSTTNGDAGDVVTVTITVENKGTSDTFDVIIEDVLDSNFISIAENSTPAGFNFNYDLPANKVTYSDGTILDGETLTFTFNVTLASSVKVGEVLSNTATVIQATTLPGIDPGERDEPDENSQTTINIDKPTISKTMTGTNLGHTSGQNVVVGELIYYQLELHIPEGESDNFTIVDTLDEGLAFVSIDSITAGANIATDYAGGFNQARLDAVFSAEGIGAQNVDRKVTIDLGNLTNLSGAAADTITVTYTAVVIDTAVVSNGSTHNNTAVINWGGPGADSASDNGPNVTIVEPSLVVEKTSNLTEADAGDNVTFTIKIYHDATSSANAFDVEFTDIIPADMIYVGGSLTHVSGLAPTNLDDTGGNLTVSYNEIATTVNSTTPSVFEFQVNLADNVTPNQNITNTGNLTWTTTPGDPGQQSPNNTLSTERTDTEDDDATITVIIPEPSKSIVSTSQAHTIGNDVVIGEQIRYRLEIDISETTMVDFLVKDTLGKGLLYQGNAKISFIADLDIGEEGDLAGADNDQTPPTFDLPLGRISTATVGDNTVITFDLGDIINYDRDPNSEKILIEYDALVQNIADNQNATDIDNVFRVEVDGEAYPDSSPETIHVVEPQLTTSKVITSDTSNLQAGDKIDYRVTIQHHTSSSADAFDVQLLDTMPTGLKIDDASVSLSGTSATWQVSADKTTITLGINGDFDLPDGDVVVLTYSAILQPDINPGQEFINDADVTWTSLDGNVAEERDGSGGVNDYAETKTATTNALPYIGIEKSLQSSELDNDYTIGEEVAYELKVSFIEGLTTGVVVTDTLPTGLSYKNLSATIVQAGGHITNSNFSVNYDSVNRIISFDLGDINNVDNSNETDNYVTIRYKVLVNNTSAINQNISKTNAVEVASGSLKSDR